MKYSHTQRAPLHLLLHATGLFVVGLAWVARNDWPAPLILCFVASVMFLLAAAMANLTVRDEGDFLEIQFGPLPIFRCQIRYADIESVQAARSSWIDGWGIHWVPGRGWTYNLWGRDCVELRVQGRIIRIGTDDRDNLISFLSSRIG